MKHDHEPILPFEEESAPEASSVEALSPLERQFLEAFDGCNDCSVSNLCYTHQNMFNKLAKKDPDFNPLRGRQE